MLGDIGGTNARFAWQAGPGAPLQCVQVLQCADHASLAQAARHWLERHGLPQPRAAAVAVACPVHGDEIRFTNNDWSFSVQALKSRLALDRLVVINDFKALALALPIIPAAHLIPLGPVPQTPFATAAPVALLGAGTGLGVSGLLPAPQGGWTAIEGEGGHVSLAIHTERQYRLWSVLRERYGHVSLERVLSGQGLVNLHAGLTALSAAGGWPQQPLSAAQITERALLGSDPLAVEALQLFCAWLGSAAGDVALTLGARGGVFLGGGIVPRIHRFLQGSAFRRCFEAKGRFAEFLRTVPVWLIDAPVSPALEGAGSLLDTA